MSAEGAAEESVWEDSAFAGDESTVLLNDTSAPGGGGAGNYDLDYAYDDNYDDSAYSEQFGYADGAAADGGGGGGDDDSDDDCDDLLAFLGADAASATDAVGTAARIRAAEASGSTVRTHDIEAVTVEIFELAGADVAGGKVTVEQLQRVLCNPQTDDFGAAVLRGHPSSSLAPDMSRRAVEVRRRIEDDFGLDLGEVLDYVYNGTIAGTNLDGEELPAAMNTAGGLTIEFLNAILMELLSRRYSARKTRTLIRNDGYARDDEDHGSGDLLGADGPDGSSSTSANRRHSIVDARSDGGALPHEQQAGSDDFFRSGNEDAMHTAQPPHARSERRGSRRDSRIGMGAAAEASSTVVWQSEPDIFGRQTGADGPFEARAQPAQPFSSSKALEHFLAANDLLQNNSLYHHSVDAPSYAGDTAWGQSFRSDLSGLGPLPGASSTLGGDLPAWLEQDAVAPENYNLEPFRTTKAVESRRWDAQVLHRETRRNVERFLGIPKQTLSSTAYLVVSVLATRKHSDVWQPTQHHKDARHTKDDPMRATEAPRTNSYYIALRFGRGATQVTSVLAHSSYDSDRINWRDCQGVNDFVWRVPSEVSMGADSKGDVGGSGAEHGSGDADGTQSTRADAGGTGDAARNAAGRSAAGTDAVFQSAEDVARLKLALVACASDTPFDNKLIGEVELKIAPLLNSPVVAWHPFYAVARDPLDGLGRASDAEPASSSHFGKRAGAEVLISYMVVDPVQWLPNVAEQMPTLRPQTLAMAAFESGAHDEEDEHRAMELRKRLRSTKANAAAHLSDDEPAGSHAESKSSIMDLSELNSPYRAPVGLNSGRKRVKTPVRLIVSALQLRTSSSGLKGDLRDTFAASLSRLSKARDNAAREKRYKSGDERGRNARGDARGSSGSLFNASNDSDSIWFYLKVLHEGETFTSSMVSASHPSWALGDGAEATFVVTRTAKQVVGSGGVIGIGGASSALPGGRAGGIAKSESSSKLSGGAQGSAAGVDGDSGLGGTIVLGDSSGAVKNNNRYLSFVVELYAFRRTVESGTGAATGTTTEDEFLGRKQLLLPENNSTNIAQSQYIPLTDSADLGISWAIVDAAAITSSLVRRSVGGGPESSYFAHRESQLMAQQRKQLNLQANQNDVDEDESKHEQRHSGGHGKDWNDDTNTPATADGGRLSHKQSQNEHPVTEPQESKESSADSTGTTPSSTKSKHSIARSDTAEHRQDVVLQHNDSMAHIPSATSSRSSSDAAALPPATPPPPITAPVVTVEKVLDYTELLGQLNLRFESLIPQQDTAAVAEDDDPTDARQLGHDMTLVAINSCNRQIERLSRVMLAMTFYLKRKAQERSDRLAELEHLKEREKQLQREIFQSQAAMHEAQAEEARCVDSMRVGMKRIQRFPSLNLQSRLVCAAFLDRLQQHSDASNDVGAGAGHRRRDMLTLVNAMRGFMTCVGVADDCREAWFTRATKLFNLKDSRLQREAEAYQRNTVQEERRVHLSLHSQHLYHSFGSRTALLDGGGSSKRSGVVEENALMAQVLDTIRGPALPGPASPVPRRRPQRRASAPRRDHGVEEPVHSHREQRRAKNQQQQQQHAQHAQQNHERRRQPNTRQPRFRPPPPDRPAPAPVRAKEGRPQRMPGLAADSPSRKPRSPPRGAGSLGRDYFRKSYSGGGGGGAAASPEFFVEELTD